MNRAALLPNRSAEPLNRAAEQSNRVWPASNWSEEEKAMETERGTAPNRSRSSPPRATRNPRRRRRIGWRSLHAERTADGSTQNLSLSCHTELAHRGPAAGGGRTWRRAWWLLDEVTVGRLSSSPRRPSTMSVASAPEVSTSAVHTAASGPPCRPSFHCSPHPPLPPLAQALQLQPASCSHLALLHTVS